MWLMPIIQRKVHTKYDLNETQDKRVIYKKTVVAMIIQVTIATRYVANVYCPKEALCQMWTQYGLKQTSY